MSELIEPLGCERSDSMTLDEIKARSDTFFEWPNNKDRNYVTYNSAMLFAWDCVKDVTENPISLKDKFTAGLQCQVIRIQDLEEANANLERLCDKRQRAINRLEEQGDKDRAHGRDFIRLWKEGKERIAVLEAAIVKTLNENGHLADGENCTLIDLKRAVPTWELE